MASNTFEMKCADGETYRFERETKQGRKPSPDPLTAITVRLPKSWLDEMGKDARHLIFVAVYNSRVRKLVKT